MIPRTSLVLSCLFALTACGNGNDGSTLPIDPAPNTAQVTLDTAAGVDATIRAQVVAATLERADGTLTANLLPAPRMVTFADPNGQADGVALRNYPPATYRRLHLVTAPGSCTATARDGSQTPVDLTATSLAIEFEAEVVHRSGHRWLIARHGAFTPLTTTNGRLGWNPALVGGDAAGTALPAACITVAAVVNDSIYGTFDGDASRRVQLEFELGSQLLDDHGMPRTRLEFLRELTAGDELGVSGVVDQTGVLRGRRGHRSVRTDNPRYLGRITAVDALTVTFAMDVQALTRRGVRELLSAPDAVNVRADNAVLRVGGSFQRSTFAELAVGDLVKVGWTSREGATVIASEVEVTSRQGQPASPQIQGMVSEVSVGTNRIIVVPRRDDPLILSGRSVHRLEVTVRPTTVLLRQARNGGERTTIGLDGIVAGRDRIWLRGTATRENSLDADWIRVRTD
ncbi:MAG: hypothetical protein IPK26_08810 [Planctomycetes bacterium]|nr:hypothetical protein [Planctomycetota bacterium]